MKANIAPGTVHALVPFAVGLVVGLLLVGPSFGVDALLNLDLVATPHWPAPRSVWGLGPELPRAVPLELGISLLAEMLGGADAVLVFYVICVSISFGGMHRMVTGLGFGPLEAWTAATFFGTSPFLLTRMGVGHLTMVGAWAVLPLVHRRLLRPSEHLGASFVAAGSLAVMGFYGGLLAGICVLAGLAWERERRPVPVLGTVVASQAVWLIPGLVLLLQGPDLGDSSQFPSGVGGWVGPFRLVTGHGFWQSMFQVGGGSTVVVIITALLVVAFGLAGVSRLERDWLMPAATAAAVAAALVLADALPVVDTVYADAVGLPGLGALREPQRLFPLLGLPLAVAVPVGARRLAEGISHAWARAVRLAPLGVAVVLVAPAVWGLDGQLEPVDIPSEWEEARALTVESPGTILVLPWHRYQNVSIADQRRVLNPAIQFFGPDVIASGDLELGPRTRETAEPREDAIVDLLPAMRRGEPISEQLARLGVRWILIAHDVDYETYLPLLDDPGLSPTLAGTHLDLVEVVGWNGAMTTADGSSVEIRRPLGPLVLLDEGAAGSWAEPWVVGWIQGWRAASRSPEGLVELPGGSRVVWYWPGLLVALADLAWLAAMIVCAAQYPRVERPRTGAVEIGEIPTIAAEE